MPFGAFVGDIDTVWHTIDGAKDQGRRARLGRLLRAGRHPTVTLGGPGKLPGRTGWTASPITRHFRLTCWASAPCWRRSRVRSLALSTWATTRSSAACSASTSCTPTRRRRASRPTSLFHGYWESWITLALARTLRPGWHCLDVGANHGYYTLVMADGAGPDGRVLPVEPTPRLADLLRQTLDVNGFPNVEVVSKAASDADGKTLQLVIPARRSLNAHLAEVAGPTEDAVAVESVTIDALTRDWPRVDLIKIDVEGAEESVWRGMERTISDNPDLVVILEFNVALRGPARLPGNDRVCGVRAALHRRRCRGQGRHRRPPPERAGRRRLDAVPGAALAGRSSASSRRVLSSRTSLSSRSRVAISTASAASTVRSLHRSVARGRRRRSGAAAGRRA